MDNQLQLQICLTELKNKIILLKPSAQLIRKICCTIVFCCGVSAYAFAQTESNSVEVTHHKAIRQLLHTKGTYATPPKNPDGTVDIATLIRQLKDLQANTYNWLIWGDHSELAACEKFLSLARKAKINVWITLVPPSESPPFAKSYSEPYKLDYQQWAIAIAKLSLANKNLVAWSIDDFVHNLQLFTPQYVKQFQDSAKLINPRLAFIPCSYYAKITPLFAKNYGAIIDGILFPYRNESVKADLKDPGQVSVEIHALRNLFPKGFPIFLDVYASAHSSLGASTTEYVQEVIKSGLLSADGVLIYCHQDPVKNAEKYQVIKKQFSKYH